MDSMCRCSTVDLNKKDKITYCFMIFSLTWMLADSPLAFVAGTCWFVLQYSTVDMRNVSVRWRNAFLDESLSGG